MYELGLSRQQLNACTYRDFILLSEGYKRKIKRDKEYILTSLKFINKEMWKQARLVAYVQYAQNTKDPKNIWEFFPLPGDPSKKQMEKEILKQSKKDWDAYRDLIKAMNAKGVKV